MQFNLDNISTDDIKSIQSNISLYFRNSFRIEDIEDAVSDAYEKLLSKAIEFPKKECLLSWIFTCAKNDLLKLLKKEKRHPHIELSFECVEEISYLDWNNSNYIDEETVQMCCSIIMDICSLLGVTEHYIFLFHFAGEKKLRYVAKRIKFSYNSTKKKYYRAIIRIREEYKEFEKIMQEEGIIPCNFSFVIKKIKENVKNLKK